jgi:multidrug efflux pump subunit AcrA (membrane-fusion protein)
MTIKKKYYWIAAAIVLLVLIAYGSLASRNKVVYTPVYTVSNQDIKKTVLATGTVTSESNFNLSFKNSGTLKELRFKAGNFAKAGDTLAVLDQKEASAAINQANAAVQSARANYDKVVNGATGPEMEVAKAAVSVAQVNLNNAKATYSTTVQQQKIAITSARSTLLNSGLSAIATGSNFTNTPAISGTYIGEEEGNYKITVELSGAGYAYSFSGLERS